MVYKIQLKCGLRLPLLKFLRHLYEGWGVCPGQLASNTSTVINAFYVVCYLVEVDLLPEVFPQFYKLTRLREQFWFSLSPIIVRIDS